MKYSSVLLSVLMWFSAGVNAEEPTFSVSPKSCMVEGQFCDITIEIQWQLSKEEAVCIVIEQIKSFECFEAITQQHQLQVRTNKPIEVKLLREADKTLIASSTVNVLVKEYNRRHRQRHAWSIIQ